MYTQLLIISWCILYYLLIFFKKDTYSNNDCYVYFIIFIVLCTFHMNMYAGINMYFVSHSLVYMYSIFFWLNSLGVNMHTWARVEVDGTDKYGIDPDKDDVAEIKYGKGRCIQKWTFFLWTWYLCIHRKHRHVWILKYRPLNKGSQVCKHLAKPLSADTQGRIVIGKFIL